MSRMDKPNIVFISADDLNAWIEPLGRHPQVKTPNINRLANRSTVFSRAYCSAPYCNASRMSVFTGCLPLRTGVYGNEPFWENPLRRTTFLEHLRHLGYYSFGAGKVFHGVFDYTGANLGKTFQAKWNDRENRIAMWDEFAVAPADPLPENRPLNGLYDTAEVAGVKAHDHIFDWGVLPDDQADITPDAATVRAVKDFLDRDHDMPFFCAAGLYKPHLPWYVPQKYFALYPLDDIALPLVKQDDLDDVPDIAREWALHPPDHERVLRLGQWRHAVRGYLAAISYADNLIGQILDAIDNSKYRDNTIIVLWGDNGFHLGEKLHWRKFVLWEEATRVPMLIAPPTTIKPVPRSHEPVSLVDLFPTIFELAGLPAIADTDGVSLAPLMSGRLAVREKPVVMTWTKNNHSIRSANWRYTRYQDESEELYDHDSDPQEWTNLALSPVFGDKLKIMRLQMDAYLSIV